MASEGVKSVDMPLIAMELSATLALWLPIRQLRQRILSVNARAMEAFSALLHQASLAANAPTGTIARGILPQELTALQAFTALTRRRCTRVPIMAHTAPADSPP
mmetsp:Transcript_47035/g.78046  ORF Transcript_47035/g.78046 Transcript_47035/m.78046 type:complete len:104 (-) Transcript_47035:272-583(-)